MGGEEGRAGFGPDIAIFGREGSDGGGFFGFFVDAAELLFEFRGIQLLSSNFVHDFEELIFANDYYVFIVAGVVFQRVVLSFCRYTARIEHPLV